jgi:hypothetical protein
MESMWLGQLIRVSRFLVICAKSWRLSFAPGLTTQHLNSSFALPTIDAFVTEIDALYRSAVAGEVDGPDAGPLFEA